MDIRYCIRHGARSVYAARPKDTETLWDGLYDVCRVLEARDSDGRGLDGEWAFTHGDACDYVIVDVGLS